MFSVFTVYYFIIFPPPIVSSAYTASLITHAINTSAIQHLFQRCHGMLDQDIYFYGLLS